MDLTQRKKCKILQNSKLPLQIEALFPYEKWDAHDTENICVQSHQNDAHVGSDLLFIAFIYVHIYVP